MTMICEMPFAPHVNGFPFTTFGDPIWLKNPTTTFLSVLLLEMQKWLYPTILATLEAPNWHFLGSKLSHLNNPK
jgi:hypothetical protein